MKNPARPSLYSSATPPSDQQENVSILESLEPKRSWITVRRVILISVVLSVLAGAAFMSGLDARPAFIDELYAWFGEESSQTAASGPVPGTQDEMVLLPQTDAQTSVATIVSETPSEPVEPVLPQMEEAAIESGVADNPFASIKEPEAATLGAAAGAAAVSKAVKSGSAEVKVARKKNVTTSKKSSKSTRSKTSSAKKKQTTSGSSGNDKDVELIAALLSHVAPATAKTPKNSAKKTNGTKAGDSAGGAGATSSAAVDPKRDIVVRLGNESTDSLVKRCRALGFFEGELCRVRICSGLWGKDPACPTNSN